MSFFLPGGTLRQLMWLLLVPAALTLLVTPRWHPEFRLNWKLPEVMGVTPEQVSLWKDPPLWVDARKSEMYRKQHIPGAVELHEDAWEELLPLFLAAWRPGMKIVVYCDSEACNASQSVAVRLRRELELDNIYTLRGGWREWQKTSQ